MRLLLLLSLLLCSSFPSNGQTLPFLLQSVGTVNITGTPQPLVVRNEAFTVVGSVNSISPGTAALNLLSHINHFIILTLNAQSYDSVMSGFTKGDSLSNPSGYSPPYNKQIQRPANFTGSVAFPAYTNTTFPAVSLPADSGLTIGGPFVTLPNAPVLINPRWLSTSQKLSSAPYHGYQQSQYKVDGGKMDGFIWTAGPAGVNAMAYWNLTNSTLYSLASTYTLFDHFFSSAWGGSLLSHLYLVGGRSVQWDNGNSSPPLVLNDGFTLAYHNYSASDGLLVNLNQAAPLTWPDNFLINDITSPGFCGTPSFPVIADATSGAGPANLIDQLAGAGLGWTYFAQDWATLASQFNGTSTSCTSMQPTSSLPLIHYNRFNRPNPFNSPDSSHLQDLDLSFFPRLRNGTLDSVSWVQPDQRYDWSGANADPHDSDAWLNSTMQAIFTSPHWLDNDTLIVITFSNANGFYDHVPPPAADRFGPGERIPTIVVSPYHKGGVVNSNQYEHLSIIKMIQSRFGLSQSAGGWNPLMGQARDQGARDLANSMNEGAAGNVTRPTSAAHPTHWPSWLPLIALILVVCLI